MLRNVRVVVESLRPHAGGRAAARRRRQLQDWIEPLKIANEHLLVPAIHESLSAAGCLEDLPSEARGYLALLHTANAERNAIVLDQVLELFAAFSAAGVKAMMLKGGLSFFFGYYHLPAARMVQDIDLLVRREDLESVAAVLRSLDYRVVTSYDPVQHAVAEYGRTNSPAAIDIHIEMIDAQWVLPSQGVWARAERIEYRGVELYAPSPTDRLLHNFLHAQVHHVGGYYGGRFDLRQLYEFSRIVEHDENDIDWDEIFSIVAKHYLEGAFLLHAFAAFRLFGARWEFPAELSARTKRQYWRGVMTLAWPPLELIGRPWGNARSAFARHRMVALYGEGPLLWSQLRHTLRFLRKTGAREWVRRFARMQ